MEMPEYLRKMRGTTRGSPPRVSNNEILWSWIGSFLGITSVAFVNYLFFDGMDLSLMIGSFGASAVLIYGAVRSPLAQPRNVIGGHFLSAIVGVLCWTLLHQHLWLAQAMAVSGAIVLMHLTRTLHPPGGATALIAVIGSAEIHKLGFLFVLIPTLGALILVAVAVLVNNVPSSRRYPEIWF
ncbi:MAG: HPP family protein [Pseudomonadota bacterium]